MRPFPADLARSIEDRGTGLTLLVVRLGALGDILRTLPAVRLLRRGLPEARLVWAVDDRWSSILQAHAELNETLRFPRARLEEGGGWRWLRLGPELMRWRRTLRDRRPGLVLDFHGNLRSGLTSFLSGARVRLGYAGHQQKEGNRLFNSHHVPSGERRTPRMERNLDLVRALGLPDGPLPDAGLVIPDEARQVAHGAIGSLGSTAGFAVIAPGVSRRQAYKKPPVALLAAACRRLAGQGTLPLVVYGPGEEHDARRVVEATVQARLAPPTDLHVLAALLKQARLFVGGDTGPMHLACAVGCPVLSLYGPTDPRVNAPWGVPHESLAPPHRTYTGVKRRDRAAGGFDGLTGEMVVSAVDRLLARTR